MSVLWTAVAYASAPTSGGGTFVETSVAFSDFKFANGNTFLTQTSTNDSFGTFDGSFVSVIRIKVGANGVSNITRFHTHLLAQ